MPQYPTATNPNPFTGGNAYGGGGGRMGESGQTRAAMEGEIPQPFFRDGLDAQRSMYRRVPSAEYPDGYLGTIRSRRDDRLLKDLQNRLTSRSYQRGVHKGEKIDARDYAWPEEFNPQSGLMAEAQGRRQSPVMTLAERFAITEQQMIPRGAQSLMMMDPDRRDAMRRLMPAWR